MNLIIKTVATSILLFVITSCSSSTVNNLPITTVSVDTAIKFVAEEDAVVILDVRTLEEYEFGHIKGALNIDVLDDAFTNKVSTLDRNKTYIVHCAANAKNGRTDKSLKIMQGLGFNSLLDMSGGMVKWVKEGNPIIK